MLLNWSIDVAPGGTHFPGAEYDMGVNVKANQSHGTGGFVENRKTVRLRVTAKLSFRVARGVCGASTAHAFTKRMHFYGDITIMTETARASLL